MATLDDTRIIEASGLARSWTHPGVVYTHNDSGSGPEVFAVGPEGVRAVLTLQGAPAMDWEDVSSTPDGRIWVADIGGGDKGRSSVTVHVVKEPGVLTTTQLAATTYRLRYPDGKHDAEALLVEPMTSRVYIVTKGREGGTVFAAPRVLSPSKPQTLRAIAEAPPNVTAGDFRPDGHGFVLRSYGPAYFYTGFDEPPLVEAMPDQEQGEAITFDAAGDHVLLGSEGKNSKILRADVPSELLD